MLRWTNLSSASGKEGLEILINTFLPTSFRKRRRVDEQSDVGGESPAHVYYYITQQKFKILVVCY
ncbi:MAG: hypothetical protein JWQ34_3783 [Mucilaginibacter sp.]|nr:hypothetical protein [Mucilaginibacter sp.]